MRPAYFASLLLFSAGLTSGCKDATQSGPSGTSSAAATSSSSTTQATTPSASAAVAPAGGARLPADATGALSFAWKVANAPQEKVTVSAVAGEETIAIGTLHAEADDAPGTIATCAMRNTGGATSKLTCGGTPAYNFYTASITGGALVVTLTTGVDSEPGSEKVVEVLRRPTAATTLRATGPASPALYGNCRVGSVQRTPDGPCMRQCLKGNECKGTDKCELIAVKGTDGDHKVHACVPAK